MTQTEIIEANYMFGAEILLMQNNLSTFKKNNPASDKINESVSRIDRLIAYKQAWDELILLFNTVNALHSKKIKDIEKLSSDYSLLLNQMEL